MVVYIKTSAFLNRHLNSYLSTFSSAHPRHQLPKTFIKMIKLLGLRAHVQHIIKVILNT